MITLTDSALPNILYRGKVRDTYEVEDKLLMVATDRISAFDVVLPSGIPGKGKILSLMSAFWFQRTGHLVPNHYIAMAGDAEGLGELAGAVEAMGVPTEVAERAMVVKKAERIDIECIVRGHITGSAWSEYKRQGTAGTLPMPAGLLESQVFPEPLFTPTTKAETGHDENMTYQQVQDMVGDEMADRLRDTSIAVYGCAREYAAERGIIIADTKMEFGIIDGELHLIDELLTPDSSRFWDTEDFEVGRSQQSFDKQYVRDWLIESGWDREPPAPPLPDDVANKTAERYEEAYMRLTGKKL